MSGKKARGPFDAHRRRSTAVVAVALVAGLLAAAPVRSADAAGPIVVTTTADVVDPDDGLVSLREAFELADDDEEMSEIQLQAGAEYRLTRCGPGDDGSLGDESGDGLVVDGNGGTVRQTCDGPVMEIYGGPVTVREITIADGNRITGGCCAGGLHAFSLTDDILVEDVLLEGNRNVDGSGGGGMLADAPGGMVTVRRVVARDNQASFSGGGMRVITDLTMSDTAIVDNTAANGGGLMVGGEAQLTNVTIGGNSAVNVDGGVRFFAPATLAHVTVVDNPSPGAQLRASQALTLAGVVLAEPGVGQSNCTIVETLTSQGHNYSTDDSCGNLSQTGDVEDGADPGLRTPFAIGSTVAAYPEASSPLLDVVPTLDLQLPDADQRGLARPQGAGGEVGALEVAPCGGLFPDVAAAHPFCWEIGWLNATGITGGFPDGTYRPTGTVTRQSMAAFLYRMAGSPAFSPPPSPSFSDVATAHPFFLEIEWLAATGVADGFPDGTYRPGAGVTRQSMAAFLHRLAGSPLIESPTPSFTDVPFGHPFLAEIEWLADTGVTTGFPDGSFRPSGQVTRQSMAAFLYRYADSLTVEV